MKLQTHLIRSCSTAGFLGVFFVASTALGQTTGAPPVGKEAWEAETLSNEALGAKLDETSKEVEKIRADAKADTPEGQRRTALMRRAELLNELLAVVKSRDSVRVQSEGLPKKKAELEAKVKALESLGEPETPAQPTPQRLEELNRKLDAQRKSLDALKEEESARSKRVEETPARRTQTSERGTTAEAAVTQYSTELAAAQEGPQKTLLTLRLGNATLESRVAKQSLALYDEELNFEKEASSYRTPAINYQQRLVEQTIPRRFQG